MKKEMFSFRTKKPPAFSIVHFALECNSAFRSDLYLASMYRCIWSPYTSALEKYNNEVMFMRYQRIQDMRVDADLSQKQMGEILHISQRSYSHYETGTRSIPIELLIRLANYYDTSIDYLVGRTDNKEPPK